MLKKLNDGPKNLNLRAKKEQKQQDTSENDSFLALARKKDLEEKKAKQVAAEKEKEAVRVAKEKEAADAEKQQEKEKVRLAREQENLAKERDKAAKKQANAEAKKVKKELRASTRSAAKTNSDSNSPKIGVKQRAIAIVIAVIVIVEVGVVNQLSSKSGDSQVAADSNKTPTFTWSALISGESKAQTGAGTTFEIYVCDQNVIASSLEVSNISSRPKSAGPLSTKVIKGDERCGKAFDTI